MNESMFSETLKIASYGAYGTRKTLQIRWLIEAFGADHVGIISAESGLNTVRSAVDPAMVRVVTSIDEFRAAFGWAAETLTTPQHWLCVDGASRVMQFIANAHFKYAEAAYKNIAEGRPLDKSLMMYGRFISKSGNNLGMDTQGLYGRIGRDSENLLAALIGLPCSLYANYLEDMTESDGRQKTPPYGPDVPGKVGLRAVMSSFDYVLRLSVGSDGAVVATTGSSPMYLARTREDRAAGINIPAEIKGFRLDEFVRLISGAAMPVEALEFNSEPAN